MSLISEGYGLKYFFDTKTSQVVVKTLKPVFGDLLMPTSPLILDAG
jgi:hypothetical protein